MADVADRILAGRAANVNNVGDAYNNANRAQQVFAQNQRNLAQSLKVGDRALEDSAKRVGMLRRAYEETTGTIRKYGIEISGAAAATQLLRLEQRDTAKGIEHFYKVSDKLPTKLNRTGHYFENLGKTGSQAYGSIGNALDNLVSGEFRKSWKDVKSMTGDGGLIDTFLGTEGAMGAIMTSRRFAANVAKDAHAMAIAYNIPAEAVRDLQGQLMMTMRKGTQGTKAYQMELRGLTDRILFAKKVMGVDEAQAVEFVNKSIWEFGRSAESAGKTLTSLNNYVELSNELLQKEGKLTKGATAQWKDDYARAVLEASASSKHLFLNTDKLAESMMSAAHASHEAGLSYSQTQRVMKAIPSMLNNVPDFMQQKIGGSFLNMVNDAEKYKAFLQKLPEEQRKQVHRSCSNAWRSSR